MNRETLKLQALDLFWWAAFNVCAAVLVPVGSALCGIFTKTRAKHIEAAHAYHYASERSRT